MYDDIANSEDNPRPGIVINHPEGEDVYAGVPKVWFVFLRSFFGLSGVVSFFLTIRFIAFRIMLERM